jgi:hypothetical protein
LLGDCGQLKIFNSSVSNPSFDGLRLSARSNKHRINPTISTGSATEFIDARSPWIASPSLASFFDGGGAGDGGAQPRRNLKISVSASKNEAKSGR